MKIIATLCLLLFILLAVKSKLGLKRRGGFGRGVYDLPTDTKESTFSIAIAELVATAGGIYVSLLLLFTFLDLEVPGKIALMGIQVDTLAGISLGVALLQPILLGIFRKIVL